MREKTFTKKELLKMWERTPERQQNVCATKIIEAIQLTNGDIAICFSGGNDCKNCPLNDRTTCIPELIYKF